MIVLFVVSFWDTQVECGVRSDRLANHSPEVVVNLPPHLHLDISIETRL